MCSPTVKRGFTLIELLVVIAIIAILASILFPVFAKAREKARQTQCTSNLKQLATAIQMYAQDNKGRYPGSGATEAQNWTTQLNNYVSSPPMFTCPSEPSADGEGDQVNYGYNGMLVRPNGSGVTEAQVKFPSQVGALVDAAPNKPMGQGALIGGGGLLDPMQFSAEPVGRHNRGAVVGYCDGHAAFVPDAVAPKDIYNALNRSFYMSHALGLVENGGGGLRSCSNPPRMNETDAPSQAMYSIGGDRCTEPFLTAAAEVWKAKTYVAYSTTNFTGQENTSMRSPNYIWGHGDGLKPGSTYGDDFVALAKDAMVVIVSNDCKIGAEQPKFVNNTRWDLLTNAQRNQFIELTGAQKFRMRDLQTKKNFDTYLVRSSDIRLMFGEPTGTSVYYQGYTYDTNSGSRKFFERMFRTDPADTATNFVSKNCITVRDDAEMVDKVATDPYGIGYCSAAFADTTRVKILAIISGDTAQPDNLDQATWDQIYIFPNKNIKIKGQVYDELIGTGANVNWPLTRILYASFGGKVRDDGNFYTMKRYCFTGGSTPAKDRSGSSYARPIIFGSSTVSNGDSTTADGLIQNYTGPLFRTSYFPVPTGEQN